jgi:hypothetical protein
MDLVCSGPNICGIDVLCDCRGGHSELHDRHHRPHRLVCPAHVQFIKLKATRLSRWGFEQPMLAAYEPIMQLLQEGHSVLMGCLNGRHRSGKSATDVVASSLLDFMIHQSGFIEWRFSNSFSGEAASPVTPLTNSIAEPQFSETHFAESLSGW